MEAYFLLHLQTCGREGVVNGEASSFFLNVKRIPFVCVCVVVCLCSGGIFLNN